MIISFILIKFRKRIGIALIGIRICSILIDIGIVGKRKKNR
jgi:hypothetical protein